MLTVSAYDWKVIDASTDDNHVAIHAWCLDKDSKPYLLRFNNFPAFCHVELPTIVNGRPYNWKYGWNRVVEWLKEILKDNAPLEATLSYKSKLYYYRPATNTVRPDAPAKSTTFPMLILTFRTIAAMKACEKMLSRPARVTGLATLNCKVWETQISLERKLLSLQKLGYCQWFTVTGEQVDESERISVLEREYICNWTTITPLDPKLTTSWSTKPGMLSFDIECYSDNHKAMPHRNDAAHVAYMISALYQRVGDKSTLKRHLIILGECNEIDNAVVTRVKDEVELCHELCRLIQLYDPELIIGYNIFGFDYPYLDARLKRAIEDWLPCGRLKGKKPKMRHLSWSSSAYKHQDLYILDIDGRINFDGLPYVQRGSKLPKYDMNTVTLEFLGRGKHDVKPIEMFQIYERLQAGASPDAIDAMTRVAKYCIEDAELVLDLFEKLHIWIDLVELSNIVGVTIMDLFTRGQQMRCLSQIYDLASQLDVVLDRRITMEESFSGGFVFEPEAGVYDHVICLDFKSLYPSIIMAFNICYTTLVPPELEKVIPDEMCNIIECVEDENTDKAEFETDDSDRTEADGLGLTSPSANFGRAFGRLTGDIDEDDEEDEAKKTKSVRRFRYKFLKREYKLGVLPQLVSRLVDGRTAVRKQQKEYEEGSLSWMILEKRQNALKVSANSVFGFLGVANGKLALMEGARSITAKGRELITFCNNYLQTKYLARIIYNDTDSTMFVIPSVKTNAEALEWGDKLEKEISAQFTKPLYTEFEKAGRMFSIKKKKYAFWKIDKETKNLTVTENFLFVNEGKRCKITALWPINDMKEKDYFKSIYQKSLAVVPDGEFNLENLALMPMKNLWKSASEVSRIKREEKVRVYDPETRQVVTLIKVVLPSVMTRGIILARRDNCAWQRYFYNRILDEVLERSPMLQTLEMIQDECLRLQTNQVSPSDLVIIRGLGADYKSESYFMKIFADELVKIGRPAAPGDRLDYVIVKTDLAGADGRQLLGHKMRLYDYYLEQKRDGLAEPIDNDYYLEKVVKNCIEQLFQLGYRHELEELKAKLIQSDHENLFAELVRQGYGKAVEMCYEKCKGDYPTMLEMMMDTKGLKTRVKKLKTFYLTRFRRLNTRPDIHPIEMMRKLFIAKDAYVKELADTFWINKHRKIMRICMYELTQRWPVSS